ncbi:MAG: amidohydrolase family protein, partial [Sciscionella sp.]|nr:amidohydrolase family protein [Sciscionella sp.]
MTHTTLLVDGRVYAPGMPEATAMAVDGDTIAWLGDDATGRARYPAAEVIRLDGAFVAPAFVDAHVHATATGLLSTGLDLTGTTSLSDCLRAVSAYAATHPGEVIIGHGWQETAWPQRRPPTRAELDEATGGSPAYVTRIDVHSALVSSSMLALAPKAKGANGFSVDGPITADAHHLVRQVAMRSLTPTARRRAQLAFLRDAAAHGIACVHECAGPDTSGEHDLTDLLELSTVDDKPVSSTVDSHVSTVDSFPEVVAYWGELGAVDTARRLGAHGVGGDLFVDGALGSRTAALRAPYADAPAGSPTTGNLYLDATAIAEHVIVCTESGVQAGFHAIGDAAVAEVVAGFERAAERVGAAAIAERVHRVEHLEVIDREQAKTLAALGVCASTQPMFDELWGGEHGMYAQRLGEDRGVRLNPFAMLAGAGMTLAFGSDAPVTPVGPWAAVR